ncbi:MAG: ATP-binding protein, partial [Microbacterium sp.]
MTDVGADPGEDRRVMMVASVAVAAVIAVYTSVQSVMVLGVFSRVLSGTAQVASIELIVRTGVNLTGVGLFAAAIWVIHPERRGGRGRFLVSLVIAAAASIVRSALQLAVGVYALGDASTARTVAVELIMATTLFLFSLAIGFAHVGVWRHARRGDRMRLAAQQREVALLRELQEEELRVRREVAETIHGAVQGSFVIMEAQLRRLAARSDDREPLEAVAAQLGRLRESELRAMSARLYPVDLDRGMDAAVRTLLARLPEWVDAIDDASDALSRCDAQLPVEARVLVVRVIEDAVSNALRHGRAHRIRVTARIERAGLHVVVVNDGAAPPEKVRLSGLGRLARLAEAFGGELTLVTADAAGTGAGAGAGAGAGTGAGAG